jgi:hypothetical protein
MLVGKFEYAQNDREGARDLGPGHVAHLDAGAHLSRQQALCAAGIGYE